MATKYCVKCDKDCTYTTKVFNTVVCDCCNCIISSDKGIGTVG